ncbi:hypothetical protein CLIB1423_21S01618 [[Candida] railenensis]|uniref:Oxo-4-hydroxy-4-carboxy-5-ureidoimidazoline decarboxylase domain-containing protein n=1 Tax=[Candida] railenensis TaxID=45579 RepID=A0A9P0QUY2_9ASCO|nr:hypothetical protein CLIB1423_21S01618 [[Candida] railenensis]
MTFSLPSVKSLPELSDSKKIEVLDHLFEPCSTLQAFLLPKVFLANFQSYREFIEASRKELLKFLSESKNGSDPRISKIIAAHPRLGAPKPGKVAETLSEHSSAEQKSLQGSPEEQAKLVELNEKYEQTFPGLRYVVFVNGRSRPTVMQNMIERIERNDIELEREDAFNAMCDIALDRASKLGAKL